MSGYAILYNLRASYQKAPFEHDCHFVNNKCAICDQEQTAQDKESSMKLIDKINCVGLTLMYITMFLAVIVCLEHEMNDARIEVIPSLKGEVYAVDAKLTNLKSLIMPSCLIQPEQFKKGERYHVSRLNPSN